MSKVPSKKVVDWNEIRKKDSQNPRAMFTECSSSSLNTKIAISLQNAVQDYLFTTLLKLFLKINFRLKPLASVLTTDARTSPWNHFNATYKG